MYKEKIKKIFAFVILGLVSPLIFEPVARIIQNSGNGFLSACIDYFYYCCGNVDGIEVLYTNTIFIISLCIYFLLIHLLNTDSIINKIDKIDFKIDKHNFHSLPKSLFMKKLSNNITIILILFTFLWSLLFLLISTIYSYIPLIKYNDFKKDIIQITPYIEKNELDLLYSKWVSMENKSDYEEIYNRILDIKQDNNLN